MPTAIVVENVSKQYTLGETHRNVSFREALTSIVTRPFRRHAHQGETILALDDVSFEVKEGQVVGLIGRNGAGKSTLLKVLTKITYPTSGRMKVCGRVAALLEVGTGFHSELTGRENIYLNGSILGMKKREIETQFDAIVAFAGVETFIDTPIKRYSSGMRLRLGFAVAAHLVPEVLLVDEVLAVGDVEFQKKCLQAMDDLRSGGRTVVFVSHNMAAVENLCSRAIWIDNGRIREDGAAKDVIKSYMSIFAKSRQAGSGTLRSANRRGSGEIQITGVEFLDTEGRPKPLIRCGDPVVVRLYYECHKRVLRPHFGFEIRTDLGTLVANVSTWSAGVEIPHLDPGEAYADLEFEALNLIPATYYASLWVQSTGGITYDYLDLCTVLDVESPERHASGRELDSQFGIAFLPCKWKCQAPASLSV